MGAAPLSTHEVAFHAMEVQAQLLEAAVRGYQIRGLRKLLTRSLAEEVVEIVKAIAPPLTLELGAHQAWFSSTVKAALPDVRALAIEANPDVHARYRARVEAAGVEYVNHAVSDHAGPVTLTVPSKANTGSIKTMGSLLHHVDAVSEKTVEVEAIRLDDYLGDAADQRNVMWIDVEGAIGMVLRGAERALAHCELLFAEIEPHQVWDGQMIDREVTEFLARFGLIPVLRDVQRQKRGYNALFLRPERLRDEAVRAAIARYGATMVSRPDPAAEAAMPEKPEKPNKGRKPDAPAAIDPAAAARREERRARRRAARGA